jgi:hypothetical protein
MALNKLPINAAEAVNVLILPSAARTSSSTGVNDGAGGTSVAGKFGGIGYYTSADVFVTCSARSGTSPTLNVYLQKLSPDGSTWQDIASSVQITAAGNQSLTAISASTAPFTPTDATLAAGTLKLASMGSQWRIKYVLAGTNPSFTFGVYGNFYR